METWYHPLVKIKYYIGTKKQFSMKIRTENTQYLVGCCDYIRMIGQNLLLKWLQEAITQ